MDRILRGPGGTVELELFDTAGDPVDAGAGNGTADVVDSNGVAIAGSPLTATHGSTGVYTIALPSTLTTLDVYDVTWNLPDSTTRTTQFELVGSFLFAQADLRALDSVLNDEATFPDAAIVKARQNAEERFEKAGNVSFTLRGGREYHDPTGTDTLLSRYEELRSLVACTIGGNAIAVSDVSVYPDGRLRYPAGWGLFNGTPRTIMTLVEHGYASVPEPVERAGLLYARTTLLRSALEQSDRATAVFTDLGGYRITLAGRDGPTGIPEVDAVLAQFGRRQAGAFA